MLRGLFSAIFGVRQAQRLAFACRPPRRIGDAFQILDLVLI
jgi:hypothetical protein